MSETYNITLDSQLGERLGTLTLDGNGRSVSGIISLLGFDSVFALSSKLRENAENISRTTIRRKNRLRLSTMNVAS